MRLFKESEDEGNYKSLKMKVSGMHCEGYNQSIQKSLSKVDGVRNVQADFRNEEVRMHLDESKLDLEKIRSIIRKIGFIPGVEQIGNQ